MLFSSSLSASLLFVLPSLFSLAFAWVDPTIYDNGGSLYDYSTNVTRKYTFDVTLSVIAPDGEPFAGLQAELKSEEKERAMELELTFPLPSPSFLYLLRFQLSKASVGKLY